MTTDIKEGEKLRPVNTEPLPGNTVAPPLEKEETYTLGKKCIDSKGNEHFDVGLVSKYNFIRSHDTGEELPDGDKIHWCHPTRFERA